MKKSVLSLAGAVSVGVVALGLIGSSAAVADPGSATDYRTYAAVGSDTTQSVWNGLANGTVSPSVASWDAFPPARPPRSRRRAPALRSTVRRAPAPAFRL